MGRHLQLLPPSLHVEETEGLCFCAEFALAEQPRLETDHAIPDGESEFAET